jgi:hypothetical protein
MSQNTANFTMSLTTLTQHQKDLANKYLSAYSFYYMVGDALLTGSPLSVVRMGDGEREILEEVKWKCDVGYGQNLVSVRDTEWRTRLGFDGITCDEAYSRILEAGNTCSHFAPSVSGLSIPEFDLFQYFVPRDQYLDNFFVNIWNTQYKVELYKAAQDILFIHRSRGAADALQIRCKNKLGVKVSYLELSKWEQTEGVIQQAVENTDAKLVLFAGGPASKYLSPRIAASGKVVLDIGNTTDYWLLHDL